MIVTQSRSFRKEIANIHIMENKDDFFAKAKEMTDKAGKLIEEGFDKAKEGFEKAKESETYAKFSDAVKQAGDAVEKKIDELKQSDLPGKAGKFRDQAETKAETLIDQAKAYGSILASDMEQVIDNVKGKLAGDGKKKV
jgi:hypothetical protein